MKPYYRHDDVTVYCADARDVLPMVTADTIITDPVWPGASVPLEGADDPQGLLASTLRVAPASVRRVAVHLGCDSDPRFLQAVPERWEFFRTCWLELARVGYKGRLLMTGDVAYFFGEPPSSKPGRRVIPGKYMDADPNGKQANHPCPRKLGHVEWLVKWWSDDEDVICDPFAGSGTTGLAALRWDRSAILIEIVEEHCEEIVQRLERDLSKPRLPMSYA